jgi:hypothetical protein
MESPSSCGAEFDEDQEMFTPDLTVPDAEVVFVDASDGTGDESGGEEFGEEFDDAHSTLSVAHGRGLSPVAEVSPEQILGSSESLNRNTEDLESELNTALSRLSTLTNELTEVEVSVLESRQTTTTETVTFASVPEAWQSRKNSSGSSYEGRYSMMNVLSIPLSTASHSKHTLSCCICWSCVPSAVVVVIGVDCKTIRCWYSVTLSGNLWCVIPD